MALITILTDDGKPMLIHTSVFDQLLPRQARALGQWRDVWAKVDARQHQAHRQEETAHR